MLRIEQSFPLPPRISAHVITYDGEAAAFERCAAAWHSSDWGVPPTVHRQPSEWTGRLVWENSPANWLRAIRRIIGYSDDAPSPYYLIAEGDVIPSPHLRKAIEAWQPYIRDEVDFASLYLPDAIQKNGFFAEVNEAERWGTVDYERLTGDGNTRPWGSQCYLVSRAFLEDVAKLWEGHWWSSFAGFPSLQDHRFLRIAQHTGRKCYYHLPDLAQHQADSSAFATPRHRSTTFDGSWTIPAPAIMAQVKPPIFERSVDCARINLPILRSDKAGTPCGCRGKWLMRCDLHYACTITDPRDGVKNCQTCHDYLPADEFNALEPMESCGVVIGSYGLPRLIELQIRLIREHNGHVPILISDDCSDGSGATPLASSIYGQLCSLQETYSDVLVVSPPDRMGHAGGDLGAVFWGLQWAKARKIKYLAKLSQRLLLDLPGWLERGRRQLVASDLSTASRPCQEGEGSFVLRTECFMMDVQKWHTPANLNHIRPRHLSNVAGHWGVAAETVIGDAIEHRLEGAGKFCHWDLMGDQRLTRYDGVIWHCSHSNEEYVEIAKKHGIELDASFSTDGWYGMRQIIPYMG